MIEHMEPEDRSIIEIYWRKKVIYGYNSVDLQTICQWFRRVKSCAQQLSNIFVVFWCFLIIYLFISSTSRMRQKVNLETANSWF